MLVPSDAGKIIEPVADQGPWAIAFSLLLLAALHGIRLWADSKRTAGVAAVMQKVGDLSSRLQMLEGDIGELLQDLRGLTKLHADPDSRVSTYGMRETLADLGEKLDKLLGRKNGNGGAT